MSEKSMAPVTCEDWEKLCKEQREFAKGLLDKGVSAHMIELAIALSSLTEHSLDNCYAMLSFARERVQEAFRSL